jgi:transposase
MNTTHALKTNSQDRGERVSVTPAQIIKLGLDVHADRIVVVRQIDDALPQPAQRFTHPQFLEWVNKQRAVAREVWSCYEAGPFGYGLHRQLEALGVNNLVVCPQDWDERGKKVKTDKRDASALLQRLDRYVRGNRQALAVVRVPTVEQEQKRAQTRLREQVRRTRQQVEAQGRSALLFEGIRQTGRWWEKQRWEKLRLTLPGPLTERLEVLRELIELAHTKVEQLTGTIEKAAPSGLPRGLGALTHEQLDREVGDWGRFTNRRQVGSYTGMCPGEDSSGLRHRQGSINKHGNPRVRHVLVELAWRVVWYQPGYKPLQRWKAVLRHPRSTSSARKKAIVALGRRLAIDLWRIKTGRMKAQEVGLQLND